MSPSMKFFLLESLVMFGVPALLVIAGMTIFDNPLLSFSIYVFNMIATRGAIALCADAKIAAVDTFKQMAKEMYGKAGME